MSEYNDYPLELIAKSMQRRADAGAETYMKWTCVGCGDRVTATQPNTVYRQAQHEECGAITDIEKTGCNFLFIQRIGR
jgi:hypothetical protein